MNRIKKKESNFTQVSNVVLRDKRISFKAKGLFCYMYSMDENWNFTLQSIATQQKDGLDSVKSAMDELKQYAYVIYEKLANGKGLYYLDDEPKVENPNVENPNLGKSTPIKKTNLDKNTNKSDYDSFIDELKAKVPIKSKVTSTTKGRKLFKNIENKEQLIIDYIEYQKLKKEYAIRITDFMEDYETIYKNSNINYDVYLTLWNEFASKNNLRTHPILTSVNKNNIKARLEDYKNFFEMFKYSLIKAKESSFLMSCDYFDFEWLITNDDNIIKVYKGKYDDKKGVEVII